jgi:hypothetical protein
MKHPQLWRRDADLFGLSCCRNKPNRAAAGANALIFSVNLACHHAIVRSIDRYGDFDIVPLQARALATAM